MTDKLSATQHSLLKTAAGSEDRAIRWPATLRGGARTRIVAALLAAGLAENRQGTLTATDAGLRAVGVEPASAPKAKRPGRARTAPETDGVKVPRADSKQARLIEMLKRPEGASLAEIVEAFQWLPHTARGVIAGALKKKLGLKVISEKVEGRRVYAIRAEG